MKYLSETPEFRQWVEKRKRAAEQRKCWPLRVLHAALDGYLSELDHMLAAPARLAPWRKSKGLESFLLRYSAGSC